jgi:hypothetical protein
VKFINTDGMALIGPGSEWLWTMAQFLALAITGLAIFRQLRAQRSASLFDQTGAWDREFEGPRMVRQKLALLLAIEDRDPAEGLPVANDEVPDFFDRLGYLVSRGHVGVEDFWQFARPVVSFYWGVLAPYIERDRAANDDPTFYHWFELLELEMRRIDMKRTGRAVVFDPATRDRKIAERIPNFRSKLLRERDDWPGLVPALEGLPARREAGAPRRTQ